MQRYFYSDNQGKWRGPVAYARLATLHQSGQLHADTLIVPEAPGEPQPVVRVATYRSTKFGDAEQTGACAIVSASMSRGKNSDALFGFGDPSTWRFVSGIEPHELIAVILTIFTLMGFLLISAKSTPRVRPMPAPIRAGAKPASTSAPAPTSLPSRAGTSRPGSQ